jgi:hypothetical protein
MTRARSTVSASLLDENPRKIGGVWVPLVPTGSKAYKALEETRVGQITYHKDACPLDSLLLRQVRLAINGTLTNLLLCLAIIGGCVSKAFHNLCKLCGVS